MDNVGDGVPMDETPSNTSLLSFDLCGAFVPRAAAPPRRFFAEPAP